MFRSSGACKSRVKSWILRLSVYHHHQFSTRISMRTYVMASKPRSTIIILNVFFMMRMFLLNGLRMPECIIAAAAARVGKKVLHLDRNSYYGGDWSSFSYDTFVNWINDQINNTQSAAEAPMSSIPLIESFLQAEDEKLHFCPLNCNNISNVSFKAYVKEEEEPASRPEPSTSMEVDQSSPLEDVTTIQTSETRDTEPIVEETSSFVTNDEDNAGVSNSDSEETQNIIPPSQLPTHLPVHQEWTLKGFYDSRRKFNIDLAPKVMFSRGSLVELLISSNIARYAEFQCISRVLTYINDHIEQVPCSRADVFSTKNVTVVEKRMLMKFLNFCLKFEDHAEEYRDFENKPFVEFLKSRKVTSNVEHYVLHAIAMVDSSCCTLEGLKSTQKFLQSLGRYGTSPFLCTCYGSAELPQCFCRLCAVFEGMYYLKRSVQGVISKDNIVQGIVTNGQRIACQELVMESSYAPSQFHAATTVPERISRAILITDGSLYPSDKRESTLLRLPPGAGIAKTVTVVELSSKNYVCPEDLNLVYMFCRSSAATAEEDLSTAVELLFKYNVKDSDAPESHDSKPKVLWQIFYNQKDTTTQSVSADIPQGVHITSSPDLSLDYEYAVEEARSIFGKMCPGEEFLPRAPDPEDILIEHQNNPGEEDDGKIENDVSETETTTNTDGIIENDVSETETATNTDRKIENDVSETETTTNDDKRSTKEEKKTDE